MDFQWEYTMLREQRRMLLFITTDSEVPWDAIRRQGGRDDDRRGESHLRARALMWNFTFVFIASNSYVLIPLLKLNETKIIF